MIRVNLYITAQQKKILEMSGNVSVAEHVRRAIDEYIEKRKIKTFSPTRKAGETYGNN